MDSESNNKLEKLIDFIKFRLVYIFFSTSSNMKRFLLILVNQQLDHMIWQNGPQHL